METAILGGYVEHVTQFHPTAPLPGVYLADEIFEQRRAPGGPIWATRSSSPS